VILTLVATPLMQRISREIFKQDAAETSALVEMLTGVATVRRRRKISLAMGRSVH